MIFNIVNFYKNLTPAGKTLGKLPEAESDDMRHAPDIGFFMIRPEKA
jgi:hypothetical protein